MPSKSIARGQFTFTDSSSSDDEDNVTITPNISENDKNHNKRVPAPVPVSGLRRPYDQEPSSSSNIGRGQAEFDVAVQHQLIPESVTGSSGLSGKSEADVLKDSNEVPIENKAGNIIQPEGIHSEDTPNKLNGEPRGQLTFSDSSSSDDEDNVTITPNISQDDKNHNKRVPAPVPASDLRPCYQEPSSSNIGRGQAESDFAVQHQLIPKFVTGSFDVSSKFEADVFMDSSEVPIENKADNIIQPEGIDFEDTPNKLNGEPSEQLIFSDSSSSDYEKRAGATAAKPPQDEDSERKRIRVPTIFPWDEEYNSASYNSGSGLANSYIARIPESERGLDVMGCQEVGHMNVEVGLNASSAAGSLTTSEAVSLGLWLQQILYGRAHKIKLNHQILSLHPCVVTLEKVPVKELQELLPGQAYVAESIQQLTSRRCFTVEEMGRVCESSSSQMISEKQLFLIQRRLEINANHPLVRNLSCLKDTNPDLAAMLANQIFTMGMITAGLQEDPREMVSGLIQLLTRVLQR